MADRSVRYPQELRERAVRLVAESRPDYATEWEAMRSVAQKLGIGSTETVRKWVRKAEVDDGVRPGVTSEESAELRRLRAENRELRRANEILKAAAVESTGQRNSAAASLSAGVSKFRVLRGRELSVAAIASRSSWVR